MYGNLPLSVGCKSRASFSIIGYFHNFQWFYEDAGSSDDVEALTIQKFKGDLAYRRQEYQVEFNTEKIVPLETGPCSVPYSIFK